MSDSGNEIKATMMQEKFESVQDTPDCDAGTLAPLLLVFALLDKRSDLVNCALVCREWYRLTWHHGLWQSLSLQGATEANKRIHLLSAQPRFQSVQSINLEFAQDVSNDTVIKLASLLKLRNVNLNACQQVGDASVTVLAEKSPNLDTLSLYWNLKVTDATLAALRDHCPLLTDLNLSGCKAMTTDGIKALVMGVRNLVHLNLTRTPKVGDEGVVEAIKANSKLQTLNLYANANLTDVTFSSLDLLPSLRVVDLCGMQHMTDQGLQALAACTNLTSLNLTWCIRVTDTGVCAVVSSCPHLGLLSTHGLRGVTDAMVDALANNCASAMHSIDVRGCLGVEGRAPSELLKKLPNLTCFEVHS
ncbi:hypothetical protein CYMTET_42798 [Cymbomonas tetramitiformis]|uniref:F-box domain-containing protein n=1 Tax=Cymbomonas tetramitiformis TaxID=36881 RepID=A0AAE0C4U5_9CHLO|nr:hypothetical protein CYMTET_42798 [Cymbomonas tetramitiformis]